MSLSWPETFPEWAEKAKPMVLWRVCQKLGASKVFRPRSQEIACDALQTAMTKAAAPQRRAKDHFPTYEDFLKWMIVVARNDAALVLKKEKRHGAEIFGPHAVPGVGRAPDEEAEAKDASLAVRDCLAGLKESERQILRWYHEDELGFQEIADLLKVALSTAFRYHRNSKDLLRKCLESKGIDDLNRH